MLFFSVAPPKHLLLLVVTLLSVVHWNGADPAHAQRPKGAASAAQKGSIARVPDNAPLPPPVAEMREAILAAVRSGRIEDLQHALDWNELKPAIANERVDDPIGYWRKQSGDGGGREILAILGEILEGPPAVLPVGRDVENNSIYVWPRFAEMDLATLSPTDEVELYRLVKPAEVATMRAKKKWTWYRLAVGADGTWHTFQRFD